MLNIEKDNSWRNLLRPVLHTVSLQLSGDQDLCCWKESLGMWCDPSQGFESYVLVIILCFLSINILSFGCYLIFLIFQKTVN